MFGHRDFSFCFYQVFLETQLWHLLKQIGIVRFEFLRTTTPLRLVWDQVLVVNWASDWQKPVTVLALFLDFFLCRLRGLHVLSAVLWDAAEIMAEAAAAYLVIPFFVNFILPIEIQVQVRKRWRVWYRLLIDWSLYEAELSGSDGVIFRLSPFIAFNIIDFTEQFFQATIAVNFFTSSSAWLQGLVLGKVHCNLAWAVALVWIASHEEFIMS